MECAWESHTPLHTLLTAYNYDNTGLIAVHSPVTNSTSYDYDNYVILAKIIIVCVVLAHNRDLH